MEERYIAAPMLVSGTTEKTRTLTLVQNQFSKTFSAPLAECLMRCQTLKTLADHAKDRCRELKADRSVEALIWRDFVMLAGEEFFLSESKLLKMVRSGISMPNPPPVSLVAIPTKN